MGKGRRAERPNREKKEKIEFYQKKTSPTSKGGPLPSNVMKRECPSSHIKKNKELKSKNFLHYIRAWSIIIARRNGKKERCIL